MAAARELAPQDTALLVLRYLRENQFEQAARAFAAEADSLLRLVQPPTANQRVKGLHAVLNEYVALHARASRRSAFERAFGDDHEVRGCLSKLTAVMDDYLAARAAQPSSGTLVSAGGPCGGRAASASAAAGQAAAPVPVAVAAPANAAAPSAGRKRKSARPQRRAGDDGVQRYSSRQLFGRASSQSRHTPSPPAAGHAAAARASVGGGWARTLPSVDDEPSNESAGLPLAFNLQPLAPRDEEQLGEAIARVRAMRLAPWTRFGLALRAGWPPGCLRPMPHRVFFAGCTHSA